VHCPCRAHTRVWQKWRFSAPQTYLWFIKVWFSASTFVVKIATFAKPETIVVHFRKTAMNKIKTEILILVILWIVSLTTYSFALMNNYVLHTSDYLGLFGLIVVSTISYFRPEKLFGSILILLIFGLLNILSFAYFINLVMSFNFTVFVTPGIQLISLVLLIFLVIKKPERVIKYYRETFGYTEQEREQSRQLAKEDLKQDLRNFQTNKLNRTLQKNWFQKRLQL
jgi:hypothetical protein